MVVALHKGTNKLTPPANTIIISTPMLLDILTSLEVKASFFVVGNRISWEAATTLQRAFSEGHYIAR